MVVVARLRRLADGWGDQGLLSVQDSILVAGYPLGSGSESLSITKGIVSRVVMARYSTAQTSNKLLGVQIDAAINFGNRSAPLVGVASAALLKSSHSMYLHHCS